MMSLISDHITPYMVSSAIFRNLFSLLSLWVIIDMVEGGVDAELDRTESVFNVSFPTTLISQPGVWEME